MNVFVWIGDFFHFIPFFGIAGFNGLFGGAQMVVYGSGRNTLARLATGSELKIDHIAIEFVR
jgi:hypothetical protein